MSSRATKNWSGATAYGTAARYLASPYIVFGNSLGSGLKETHVHIMLFSRECFLLDYGAFDALSSYYTLPTPNRVGWAQDELGENDVLVIQCLLNFYKGFTYQVIVHEINPFPFTPKPG